MAFSLFDLGQEVVLQVRGLSSQGPLAVFLLLTLTSSFVLICCFIFLVFGPWPWYDVLLDTISPWLLGSAWW